MGHMEHLHRALWKTESASALGRPGTSYGTVLPPHPALREPRGWFCHVNCITKELSQPRKPQGGGSSGGGHMTGFWSWGALGKMPPLKGTKGRVVVSRALTNSDIPTSLIHIKSRRGLPGPKRVPGEPGVLVSEMLWPGTPQPRASVVLSALEPEAICQCPVLPGRGQGPFKPCLAPSVCCYVYDQLP